MKTCPYCNSGKIDWELDSDNQPGTLIMHITICNDCGRMWEMHYKFDRMELIDE